MNHKLRDHGGGLDAAILQYGGTRAGWIDLSTGINPHPYPIGTPAMSDWIQLPDQGAVNTLLVEARKFWQIPDSAAIIAAPGASALIARIPALFPTANVDIPTPTYNEHAAAFKAHGWQINSGDAKVIVHPNNPDGRWYTADDLQTSVRIIDESFCDVAPDRSLIHLADTPGTIILKSFGKFWGLAGLRLGFAIGDPALIVRLSDLIGPWPVAGPALRIGTAALQDTKWAHDTRQRLQDDADRLDTVMQDHAQLIGGTSLFRLYDVPDAAQMQDQLAHHHIWSRIFPYSKTWVRLGLPPADGWDRLKAAL
ncbi:threonine-phosphate decarboxylase [Parasulfitobacter algicola]|uniref:Aminotransferase n=1 Tax=Parasulfitobacter algicola TaxID=2614809 RepID=A0ABX2IM73_9RHOB|nr:threonine-phosphate decarboxylase [Sulfitobacter algicola]NSX53974.1 pyridoxal phosphate-dependent class II aminotransferase [Sulfitobacter algicola]